MSETVTIARAASIVAAGVLVSRLLGFGRNVLINGLFGLGTDNDLYQAAFTIPDWIFFLMAGGYLSITLVPILARHLAAGDRRAIQESFASVFTLVGGAMVVLTLATMTAARPITGFFFPRFPGDLDRLATMMRIALASQVFFVAGTLLMAVQYAHRRFLVPTLAPLVYNAGIILGGLIGYWAGDPSPEAFLWGGLAGAVVGNFGLQWWGAARLGVRLFDGSRLRHPAVAEYFGLALPLMIGQSAVALDEQWPRWFGQLAGSGTVSGLVAARQLNMLPVGVIAQAAGVAAYPFLARLFSEGRSAEFRETVERSVRSAVALAGLATAAVLALATPLVRLAYQRGQFTPEDTAVVASFLAIYALSIPLWSAHQVFSRAFYSQRRMWRPVMIGTGVTAITVPAFFGVAPRWGGSGIVAVSVAGILLYTVAIALSWYREGSDPDTMWSVGRTVLATAVAGGAGWLATRLVPGAGTAATFGQLAAGSLVVMAAYLFTARLVGLEEINGLVRRASRRT
jgi:putative peptidoglycan lipid II flippase